MRVRNIFAAGRVKERASMIQSKTGKPVRFEITETTRQSRYGCGASNAHWSPEDLRSAWR
jgi:hypothetical protein